MNDYDGRMEVYEVAAKALLDLCRKMIDDKGLTPVEIQGILEMTKMKLWEATFK